MKLTKYVPVLRLWGTYNKFYLISDFIAGTTVGLTMIPQSIAYAALAGLTPEYGLNSAFVGCFVYAVFGTVKEVSIGPTSMMALLTASYTGHLNTHFIFLLTLLSGMVELLFAILNLGFLVEFISVPVISGFVSAVAIIIAVSQVKSILGIGGKSSGFIENVKLIIKNSGRIRITGDLLLGVICIVILLLLRKLKDFKMKGVENCKEKPNNRGGRAESLNRLFWFISTSRNALVVISCMALTAYYQNYTSSVPFALTGTMESGLPPFRLPPTNTTVGNTTYTFVEMAEELGAGVVVVPLIAVLENIAIAKAFSKGQSVEAQQEMIALSLSNMLGACFGAMPTCGALTRSAVSSSSGVKSPISSVYAGILVLLSVSFLTPYFHLIPRATLSAVLICAVLFLIEWHLLIEMWKIKRLDFFITLVTLTISLCVSVEVGLLSGVAVSSCYLLYLWQKPRITFEIRRVGEEGHYMLVTPDRGLYFPAVGYMRDKILSKVEQSKSSPATTLLATVIDFKYFIGLDYTAVKELSSMVSEFEKCKQRLFFIVNESEFNTRIRKQLAHDDNSGDDELPLVCTSKKHLESVIANLQLTGQPSKQSQTLQLEQETSYIQSDNDIVITAEPLLQPQNTTR